MNPKDYNARGCPLRNQTGESAVKNFVAILERLPPELRRAFEAERQQRRAEYDQYVARYGYRT